MIRFVRFTYTLISKPGPADQSVYINPEHVRIVRPDYENRGTVIGFGRVRRARPRRLGHSNRDAFQCPEALKARSAPPT
jgi:hypothetical protein